MNTILTSHMFGLLYWRVLLLIISLKIIQLKLDFADITCKFHPLLKQLLENIGK